MPFAIYLNGTSSAGKTTITRALQNFYDMPLLATGIDLLIRQMLPEKLFLNDASEKDFYWVQEVDSSGIEVPRLYYGERAQKTYLGLVAATVGILYSGNSVVIDDVANPGKWQVDIWRDALKEFPAVFVGVHCPLEIIEKREKDRGDRPLLSARGQYEIVHKDIEYDLEVNTHTETTQAIVEKIAAAMEEKALMFR